VYPINVALGELLCGQEIAMKVALNGIDIDVLDNKPVALNNYIGHKICCIDKTRTFLTGKGFVDLAKTPDSRISADHSVRNEERIAALY
jgi:hypothetical protein